MCRKLMYQFEIILRQLQSFIQTGCVFPQKCRYCQPEFLSVCIDNSSYYVSVETRNLSADKSFYIVTKKLLKVTKKLLKVISGKPSQHYLKLTGLLSIFITNADLKANGSWPFWTSSQLKQFIVVVFYSCKYSQKFIPLVFVISRQAFDADGIWGSMIERLTEVKEQSTADDISHQTTLLIGGCADGTLVIYEWEDKQNEGEIAFSLQVK